MQVGWRDGTRRLRTWGRIALVCQVGRAVKGVGLKLRFAQAIVGSNPTLGTYSFLFVTFLA